MSDDMHSQAVLESYCASAAMLPLHLLVPILCKAGAWKAGGHTVSAWSVCREWRAAVRGSNTHLAAMLLATHGPEHALTWAATASMPDRCSLLRELLRTGRADCMHSMALVLAARYGHEDVVRLLLDWTQHAPRADCHDGEALILAASRGHAAVVALLLQQPKHAPRAACQDGRALIVAAMRGHAGVVRLLLGWPVHAPCANCQGGRALLLAAGGGHEEVVHVLEGWPQHAPQASAIFNQLVTIFWLMGTLYQGFADWWMITVIAVTILTLLLWWQRHTNHGINRGRDPALARAAAVGYLKLTLHVFRQQHPLRHRLGHAAHVTFVLVLLVLVQSCRSFFASRWARLQQLGKPLTGDDRLMQVVNTAANATMMVCLVLELMLL